MVRPDPTRGSAGSEVTRFDRDDEGYLQWVATNPHGFVLNVPRGRPEDTLLHRADCPKLSVEPEHGATWTGDYLKLTSGQKWRLDEWSLGEQGSEPARCDVCRP